MLLGFGHFRFPRHHDTTFHPSDVNRLSLVFMFHSSGRSLLAAVPVIRKRAQPSQRVNISCRRTGLVWCYQCSGNNKRPRKNEVRLHTPLNTKIVFRDCVTAHSERAKCPHVSRPNEPLARQVKLAFYPFLYQPDHVPFHRFCWYLYGRFVGARKPGSPT